MKKTKASVSDSLDALKKNGNYFFDTEISIFRKLWLFLDLIFFSVIYIILSFLLSWVLDEYTVRELDRNQSTTTLFFEVVAQLILIVIVIYVIVVVVAKYLPSIYPNEPKEHTAFKSYVLTMLIIFGVFAGEYKFRNKLRYIFNKKEDKDIEILEKISVCYLSGQLAPCVP